MIIRIINFILLCFLFSFNFTASNAQIKKNQLGKVNIEIQEGEKATLKCASKKRRVSHFCYDFCPTNLVKPQFPKDARKFGIKGKVRIEVIVNENGNVINAEVLEGKALISQAARRAALRSSFQTKRNCENKPIKFKGTIIYTFS